jgi:hypothetical protein
VRAFVHQGFFVVLEFILHDSHLATFWRCGVVGAHLCYVRFPLRPNTTGEIVLTLLLFRPPVYCAR